MVIILSHGEAIGIGVIAWEVRLVEGHKVRTRRLAHGNIQAISQAADVVGPQFRRKVSAGGITKRLSLSGRL